VPTADPETRGSDRRTFDVLFAHSVPADAAFAAIGEINNDIDLKDGKYGGEEGLAFATWSPTSYPRATTTIHG
jgi:hypothetical protein